MKKFTSVLVLVAFVAIAFAQERIVSHGVKMNDFEFSSKNYDTLVPYGLQVGNPVLYGVIDDGGFLAGTNSYGDWAKAQLWTVDFSYNVIGCMVWIGERIGTVGTVNFNIYNSNGNGTAMSGPVNYAPGTILASVNNVPITDFAEDGSFLADGGYIFTLASPLFVTFDYYTGLDFQAVPNFPTNQLGIVSSEDGTAGMTELAWEKWNDNNWYSFQGAGWGGGTFDSDMAFFPIIDQSSGIENFVNNIKLNCYPNPVSETATIEFELKNSAQNVNVVVTDLNGKVVLRFDLGAQAAGSQSISFDASQLASGTYVYLINADRNRLAKQFIVK